ncbi:MAG: hypothetical protein AAF593_17535, partial [Planctomycetota bacterium]
MSEPKACPFDPGPTNESASPFEFAPFEGPLASTNDGFHRVYDGLVAEIVPQLGDSTPVVVVTANDLTLLFRGERRSETYIPDDYHKLKAISHAAFGLELTLSGAGDGPLDDSVSEKLREQLTWIDNTEVSLPECEVPIEAGDSPAAVLRMCRELIDRVLGDRAVDTPQIEAFARGVAEHLLRNAALAAFHELDGLHEVVTRWRQDLPPEAWDKAYVVVCGGHQSRYRQIAKQYFQGLLGETESTAAECEEHVLYGEGLSDPDAALDLLARHIIDQRSAHLFFGERDRLQRDLLSDAA